MAQYALHGGVGTPVGLTVFKTAGGSLGAVPGGFDSHTPLPHFTMIPTYKILRLGHVDTFAHLLGLSLRLTVT